ncbi:Type II secretion system GspH family protein [Candidatus Magnetomoraceae bacterium gMMP-15]
MKKIRENKGFTLIEILLVIVIIGILLAVIVPRAYRANIDAKYGLVRQAASELASNGSDWIEQMMLAQEADDTCAKVDYIDSLSSTAGTGVNWIPENTLNWVGTGAAHTSAVGTSNSIDGRSEDPECTVEDITAPDKWPINPFNGAPYYSTINNPNNVVVGALSCNWILDDNAQRYVAFIFQGADCTTVTAEQDTTFHAGQQEDDLEGLRNGIFWMRIR